MSHQTNARIDLYYGSIMYMISCILSRTLLFRLLVDASIAVLPLQICGTMIEPLLAKPLLFCYLFFPPHCNCSLLSNWFVLHSLKARHATSTCLCAKKNEKEMQFTIISQSLWSIMIEKWVHAISMWMRDREIFICTYSLTLSAQIDRCIFFI